MVPAVRREYNFVSLVLVARRGTLFFWRQWEILNAYCSPLLSSRERLIGGRRFPSFFAFLRLLSRQADEILYSSVVLCIRDNHVGKYRLTFRAFHSFLRGYVIFVFSFFVLSRSFDKIHCALLLLKKLYFNQSEARSSVHAVQWWHFKPREQLLALMIIRRIFRLSG